MRPDTVRAVATHAMKKGDVLGAARFAGIQAAKGADAYLPLSDPGIVTNVTITFDVGEDSIDVRASVEGSSGPPSMSALTAATVALLTVYDMCKSADRTMAIGPVALDG